MVKWSELSPATFARAKAERKFVVLDGAAEWCHWCHVMDAETYHDPAVVKLLGERFLAVKVDIDARPDVEERYAAWGWPATVVFSPDGQELGKYRGYLAPDEMLDILHTVVSGGAKSPGDDDDDIPRSAPPVEPLSKETLAWIQRWAPLELEDHWDPKEGGWGIQPKVPLGWNVMWALTRAKAGDATNIRSTATEGRSIRPSLTAATPGHSNRSASSAWGRTTDGFFQPKYRRFVARRGLR